MSSFPEIVNQERGRYLLVVVSTALLQAIAAAFAAVATRDVFSVFLEPTGLLPLRELLVLAGSGIVIALGRVGQATVAERLGQSFAGDLRERLFCHLSRMPRTAVQNQRRGGLSLRFVGDLSAIRGWAGDALPKAIAAGCVLPAACAAGFLLHPMLAAPKTGMPLCKAQRISRCQTERSDSNTPSMMPMAAAPASTARATSPNRAGGENRTLGPS